MEQFDIITGTYKPKRTDDLKPEVAQHIGASGQWQVVWIIEEGPYKDQWALAPYGWYPRGLYWASEGDVEIQARG